MAKALRSLGCKVLYIELSGSGRGLRFSQEGIAVACTPRLPLSPYAAWSFARAVNMRLAEKQLLKLQSLWGAGSAKPIFIHYGWFSGYLAERFSQARHVLDCIDEHAAADAVENRIWLAKAVRREEERLIRSCELVVCVSRRLAERRLEIARKVVVLPNGSDPSAFEGEHQEDPRIAPLPRPRVLFVGRIGPKVDIELIAQAACEEPGLSWVLAGEWTCPVPHALPPNVLVLGRVSRAELPAIAAGCAAGLVPLRATEWNLCSSPMKIGDYLAAGLPFASTRIPESERIAVELPGAVFLGQTAREFARAARAAAEVGDDIRERCRAYARAHSWRARAERLLTELGAALTST